jgi:hypothetical protein
MVDGLDKLGQFPLLQLFGGLLILLGVAYAILKGQRDSGKSAPPEPPELRWYFDGPLVQAINEMKGIYRVGNEIRDLLKDSLDERRTEHKEHMVAIRELVDRIRDLELRRR